MASEPNLFQAAEQSDEDTLTTLKTGMPKDTQEELAQKELNKLTLGRKIDFTIKSHLIDATFIVEGKKIYAGTDFLSIHSPYFKALLMGNFAERNKSEIELKDVIYEEFHTMLQCLSEYSHTIKADDVEFLLSLADRFDVKYLTDRVEEFMMKTKAFSVSEKLFLADKYRLMKLQIVIFDSIGKVDEQSTQDVLESDDYALLSDSAKEIFQEVTRVNSYYMIENVIELPIMNEKALHEVDEMEETANGLVASGFLSVCCESDSFHNSIDVAGLLWTVCNNDVLEWDRTDDSPLFTFPYYLVINRNRPTTSEWKVEGFAKIEIFATDVNDGEKKYRREKKYAFSLDNLNRVGIMNVVNDEDFMDDDYLHVANVTIYITQISGVRKSPKFDFLGSSEFSDATFMVEGRKIHVNKQYLSTISARFFELFYDSSEVVLENLKYEEVIEFLKWSYPSSGKNLTVSAMLSILSVVEKLGVDFDTSVIHNYFADSDGEVMFAEKMFLYFQFNFGDKSWLMCSAWNDTDTEKRMQGAYTQLKNSGMYAKMTPMKKLALCEWMMEMEYERGDSSEEEDEE